MYGFQRMRKIDRKEYTMQIQLIAIRMKQGRVKEAKKNKSEEENLKKSTSRRIKGKMKEERKTKLK